MKRLAVFLFMFVIGLSVMAQDGYRPMLKEGRVWIENAYLFPYRSIISVRIGEDTIVNNMKYYRIYERMDAYDDVDLSFYKGDTIKYKEYFRCLMRETDDKKVYKYADGKDELLYDFSLNVDRSLLRQNSHYTQTVTGIDTIEVNGTPYKRMAINEINGYNIAWILDRDLDLDSWKDFWSFDGYWVEGIGSNRGVTGSYKWTIDLDIAGASTITLQACYDNEKLIFRNSDFDNPGIHPMLRKGKEWVYAYHHFEDGDGKYNEEVSNVSFVIDGDTIINNRKYYVLKKKSNYTKAYYCALREEGTTVYCIRPNSNEEFVLQELDPTKFTDVFKDTWGEYTVQKDTIIVRGVPFVRYQYEPKDYGLKMTAIEGVGFKDNGIVLGMNYERPTCICDYMELLYCKCENKMFFFNKDFDTQQISEVEQVRHTPTTSSKRKDSPLYDLQGRRINGQPAKGMYIQNGRKFVK